MRRLLRISIAVALLALCAPGALLFVCATTARAATEVKLDGEIRFRSELDDRFFSEDYDTSIYHLLRTRLGVGATVEDNARVYVQLQDSRTLGGVVDRDFQSGTLNNGKNVDVHQAYLKIARLWADGLGLKLGRFEVSLGNERVFGPVDWSNVGRSWEGAMAWYEAEQLKLTGMALKRRELEGPFYPYGAAFDVYGLVADIVDPAFQFFFVYEYDSGNSLVDKTTSLQSGDHAGSQFYAANDSHENNLDRMTLGAFFKNEVENMRLDYSLNAAFQTGTVHDPRGIGIPTEEYDISAYMLNFEAGYSVECKRPVRVAGAIDYTSGDDDLTDGEWGAYDNLYYTGHKWRGFMDYFVGSMPAGLMDLMGRANVELAPSWRLMGDLHWFRTAEEYDDPLDDADATTSDVGIELDLTLKTDSIQGVQAMGGASLFIPKDAFAGMEDPKTGLWFYYQLMVSFD